MGFETAKQLLQLGHTVIFSCRNEEKLNATREKLLEFAEEDKMYGLILDLSSLKQIKEAVQRLNIPLNILICNAGLSYSSPIARYTQDGIEETFGVNHLGHFLLTDLLLKKYSANLKKITVVASDAHNPDKTNKVFPPSDFSSIRELAYPSSSPKNAGPLRYVHSKLCNVLFTYELDRRLRFKGETDITVNAFNPGFIPGTSLGKDTPAFTRFLLKYVLSKMRFMIPGMRTVQQSASDLIEVALNTQLSGKYYDGRKEVPSSDLSYDKDLAHELWEESEKLLSL